MMIQLFTVRRSGLGPASGGLAGAVFRFRVTGTCIARLPGPADTEALHSGVANVFIVARVGIAVRADSFPPATLPL
jgi:hypothetical protein